MHAANVSAFHRTVVRVAVRGALSAAAILGPAVGVTALPTPAAASTTSPTFTFAFSPNKHPDFDPDALFISTTTDTLPEDAATNFQAMAGDTVRRVYEVHNRGLLPLDDVTVFDPGANGAAIRCGSSGTSTIPTLLPLTWVACTSTFTATPGEHFNTVTASGTIFLVGVTLTDQARTGYTAVAPALSASLSINGAGAGANLPSGTPVSATVTVHNTGSVVFTQVTTAPQPPLSISGCSDGQDHDPTIHNLTPGESASCTAVLVPAPGPHVSSVTITANWRWDHPITQQGPQKPEELSVQTVASAAYTGSPATSPTPTPTPAPPSPGPSTPASPPATPGAPTPSSAAVVPQSQQPTPPPSQTPSTSAGPTPPNTPAPTPNPSQAGALLQQGVSQFQASRQLPLPLKVLVIIIIPAVAAAAGARRISSSRR